MGQCSFQRSLEYIPPPLGRAAARKRDGIPQTIRLHVSPSACGRRFTINAYRQHTKDHLVHLYIDETDIVSGCYESLIPDAVEELLDTIKPRPRAVMIQVTCIDDLLGTDHAALRALLESRFPETRFCITRRNPIALDGGLPSGYEAMRQMYSLLTPVDQRQDAVNLVCDSAETAPESELFRILEELGLEARRIDTCRDFDEFLQMAASRLNFVMTPIGEKAAAMMEQTLGIPWVFAPQSYRLADITQAYQEMAATLGRSPLDLSQYEEAARQKIARTRKRLGGMPIIVDQSATMRPLVMARALTEYGFQVKTAFDGVVLPCDIPALEWFHAEHPEIEICDGRSCDLLKRKNDLGECMCIGTSTGYMLNAPHLVEFPEPGKPYGFQAVELLMDKMFHAADAIADYSKLHTASETWQPVDCRRRGCGR